MRLPRPKRMRPGVEVPQIGILHVLREELRSTGGNQRGGHEGALLRHFLDRVDHIANGAGVSVSCDALLGLRVRALIAIL
jgi:hypothetical protein